MPERFIENRLLQAAARMRGNDAVAMVFTMASVVAATAARFWVDPYLPPGFPFLTYFPAVILTGLFAGTLYGIACMVLCAVAAWYWFIMPIESFGLNPQAVVALLFFVAVSSVDLAILHVMNKAVDHLRRQRDLSHKLAEQQKVLFQELQHRVANNLNFVSNLLAIHQSRLPVDSGAAGGLQDARIRLDTMSRVHRRLYDPSNADQKLEQYLSDLCADVLHASGIDTVNVRVEAPPVSFDLEKLLNISLIVVEAVTNALKHAYPAGIGGEIVVRIAEDGQGRYSLSIHDSGPGFPAGFSPEKSTRLGFRILQGFARSLKGDLSFKNDRGGIIQVNFPA